MTYKTMVKASEVTGVKVRNAMGEHLGEINDVVLDKTLGKINYLVLDFGGVLGFGNKFFAIPWQLFTYDANEDCFLLNIQKELLKNAPGFDKDNWPNFADADFKASIAKYYE